MKLSRKISKTLIATQILFYSALFIFYPNSNEYKLNNYTRCQDKNNKITQVEPETIIHAASLSFNETHMVSASYDASESINSNNSNICINRWGLNLSSEEIDLLARILWNEARGEEIDGQYAVVEVVFNRMLSHKYPNDLEGVLSQKGQFSSWKLRDIPINKNKDYNKQIEIVKQVLSGSTNIVPIDILYFAQKPITNNIFIKIGCHYFCKDE